MDVIIGLLIFPAGMLVLAAITCLIAYFPDAMIWPWDVFRYECQPNAIGKSDRCDYGSDRWCRKQMTRKVGQRWCCEVHAQYIEAEDARDNRKRDMEIAAETYAERVKGESE